MPKKAGKKAAAKASAKSGKKAAAKKAAPAKRVELSLVADPDSPEAYRQHLFEARQARVAKATTIPARVWDPTSVPTTFTTGYALMEETKQQRLITGLIDLDVISPPVFGHIFEILGDPNVGKSTLTHWLEGRIYRHCLYCRTLIANWVHPETGEIHPACMCRRNQHSPIHRQEAENVFEASYAAMFGAPIMAGQKQSPFYLPKTSNDLEEAFDIIFTLIDSGYAGGIIFDSLAASQPRELIAETIDKKTDKAIGLSSMVINQRTAAQARAVKQALNRLKVRLAAARQEHGIQPIVICTNQMMSNIVTGPFAHTAPKQIEAGGRGMMYAKSNSIQLYRGNTDHHETKLDPTTAKRIGRKYITVGFNAKKTRMGMEGMGGSFRFALQEYRSGLRNYKGGMTDNAEQCLDYLLQAQWITATETGKTKLLAFDDPYFGVEGLTAGQMVEHLDRDDVYLRVLFRMIKKKLPSAAAEALFESDYYYPPWETASARSTPAAVEAAQPHDPAPAGDNTDFFASLTARGKTGDEELGEGQDG